jgi:hypothetical protein
MSRATDLHKLIISVQDRHKVVELKKSKSPYLGLFYVIHEKLYWDGLPIRYCENSFHFRIYPKMHPTFWNNIIIKNKPELDKFDAYYFPRGRVVYDNKLHKYELVADKCKISNEKIVSQIIGEMKFSRKNTNILGDTHYECFKCKEEKISNLKSEIDNLTFKLPPVRC